jgi:hypothetical protein
VWKYNILIPSIHRLYSNFNKGYGYYPQRSVECDFVNHFTLVSDTRTWNSLSLVNRKFLALERCTRTSLTFRGNTCDIHMILTCFISMTHLDPSLLSRWGRSDLLSFATSNPFLLHHRLHLAFPLATSITIYSRYVSSLNIVQTAKIIK